MAMCVMAVAAVAPCQCFSSGGKPNHVARPDLVDWSVPSLRPAPLPGVGGSDAAADHELDALQLGEARFDPRDCQPVRSSFEKVKYRETIIEGLENAPNAFIGLFHGDYIGKQLVRVLA